SLAARFEEHVMDATDSFEYWIEEKETLAGVPADYIEQAAQLAGSKGKKGYVLSLQAPVVMAVLQYASNRDLRERIYRAWSTRASDLGPAEWDNSELMLRIIQLRQQEAHLLGFGNYAELSLQTKMAPSVMAVMDFLENLAVCAKPYAERDWADLNEFARNRLHMRELQAWDISYVSEKLRLERFDFSEEEVREYFPVEEVIQGLFSLAEQLYGLHIVEQHGVSKWHPDVCFYEITGSEGLPVGYFYMDLYARPMKRGGAWMDEAISRHRSENGLQAPVALLTCNFSPPIGGRSALLTHDDVLTLFHEFGHGLHHLLTEIDEIELSGIHGVEWDAVELPSQFMENFCWDWQVLSRMSKHVGTGMRFPRQLYDRMLASRYFQAGLQLLRQVEYSLFDMQLHARQDLGNPEAILDLLDKVRHQVAVVFPPSFNRFPHAFSHIFAGGYAAGYYSYKWAEVLSADAFELFEEKGVVNLDLGNRFRKEVLSRGGSRDAMESFVAFRGRQPRIDALLRASGMKSAG
ncbi:MAG: M3 family metallopeptidase, partial [Pseudomonadota bacterium]|nr:M3 family metallopeptidase [Pseudomonadota bacterium]